MRLKSIRHLMIAFFGVLFLLLILVVRATGFTIELVSVSSSSTAGNDTSSLPTVSSDGRYVAFISSATNLVSDDTNNMADVFVRDRQAGATTLVSLDESGAQLGQFSNTPAISADGRYIVFMTNNYNDVFVRDTQASTTTRANVSSTGIQADLPSDLPVISGDGRYVAFGTPADNLVPNDTNNAGDVFVHDMQTGDTVLASVPSAGGEGNNISDAPAISTDGRYIAFQCYATNMVPNDTNGAYDVFVHDMQTGQTQRVSLSSQGGEGDNFSTNPAISADGRYVAFESNADNLVPNDTNGTIDIFVHDRQTGITSRVSVSSTGVEGNSDSTVPTISSDGRFVVFVSNASNLVPNDTNGHADVFVHDTQTGETQRVSVSGQGEEADADSLQAKISANGAFIVFASNASNVGGGNSGTQHVYIVSNVLYGLPVPPPDPTNAAPVRNTFTALPVTLTWNAVSGVIGYEVEVATTNTFNGSVIVDVTTGANTLSKQISTIDNGVYYWRVRGIISETRWGAWSTPERFTVNVP